MVYAPLVRLIIFYLKLRERVHDVQEERDQEKIQISRAKSVSLVLRGRIMTDVGIVRWEKIKMKTELNVWTALLAPMLLIMDQFVVHALTAPFLLVSGVLFMVITFVHHVQMGSHLYSRWIPVLYVQIIIIQIMKQITYVSNAQKDSLRSIITENVFLQTQPHPQQQPILDQP